MVGAIRRGRIAICWQVKRENEMVNQELLEILRCPVCVHGKEGLLKLYRDSWLVCHDCGRKYPISEEIPVMLIEEGEKWVTVAEKDLPVPPPPIK
jgi:uncharacterized protein